MYKPKVIGIAGEARAGKDTIADLLVNEYNFLKLSQADKIKQTAAAMFELPIEMFYQDGWKDKIDEDWGYSPRQMCQLIGKEGSKDIFGDGIWMQHIVNVYNSMGHGLDVPQWVLDVPGINNNKISLTQYSGIVIPSIKFDDDYNGILNMSGKVLGVTRKNKLQISDHSSENEINTDKCDYIFENDNTINNLQMKVHSYFLDDNG